MLSQTSPPPGMLLHKDASQDRSRGALSLQAERESESGIVSPRLNSPLITLRGEEKTVLILGKLQKGRRCWLIRKGSVRLLLSTHGSFNALDLSRDHSPLAGINGLAKAPKPFSMRTSVILANPCQVEERFGPTHFS